MTKRKIAVVTDSTAYIPPEQSEEHQIPVIPLWLIWDGERYRDGVDIEPPTFYRRLENAETMPTTSQPSTGEFIEFFKSVSETADAIICVFISSKLSGTVANAQAAKEQLPDIPIRIVDSLSTSMGQGFAALAAARAAEEGKSLEEVVHVAERVRDRTHVLFAVDTLEYLHKGGRIGGAQRLLGTALNIKPLLHLEEGRIDALTKVRTKKRAIERMLDIVEERLNGDRIAEAAVLDVASPEDGDRVAREVGKRFGLDQICRTKVSPVIGAHVGPGTVGICFYTEPVEPAL